MTNHSNHSASGHRSRPHVVGHLSVAFCLLGLLIVVGRVFQLQTRPPEQLAATSPQTLSIHRELARRGDLLDRRGRVLATSRVGYRLFVDPQYVDDPGTVAIDLAHLIGEPAVELDRRLQDRLTTRYAVLVPLLEDAQIEAVRTASIKGAGLEPVLVRHRPYGDLAAPLIGLVGADHTGLSGVEYLFNEALTGEPGELRYLRDARRKTMWIEPVGYRPREHGRDLRLSLDIEIQRIAEEELRRQVEACNAGGGRLIVLDPQTGELLAMADVLRDRTDREPYTDDPSRRLDPALARVRCATDPYEPGSTFKPFVWAYATQLGIAEPEEVFDCHHGSYRTSRGRRIRDAHPYGELTWEMVLVKSSNIGMAQVAERMTPRQMQEVLSKFGFGVPTGCGFGGESPGIVTTPKDWTHYSQASVSFGHEVAVTPLQMVRAFAAIARDGTLPMLRLMADAGDGLPDTAVLEQRAISESIADKTRLVLHRVMTEGTGRAANEGARYAMFGKSGTAQLPNPKDGGYFENRYVSSFIAGAPLDRPRLVVLCVIEDPDRRIAHYGGIVAGPVVRNVMNRSLEYLGVAPTPAPDATESALAAAD